MNNIKDKRTQALQKMNPLIKIQDFKSEISSSWRIFEMKNYNSKREELEEEDQREDERNVIL